MIIVDLKREEDNFLGFRIFDLWHKKGNQIIRQQQTTLENEKGKSIPDLFEIFCRSGIVNIILLSCIQ
jgi:hypothetical protein